MSRRALTTACIAMLAMLVALPAGAGWRGAERPFKAGVAGRAEFDLSPSQPCPFGVRTDYYLDGIASHMGKVEVVGTHCPLPFGHSDGRATITAANGDQIFIEYEDPGTGPIDYTITGGTGRFMDASGSGIASFTVVQIYKPDCTPQGPACFDLSKPWPGTADYVGTISY